LWHEDRSSAFQSLEARVPFLDHRIVELLAGVPESLHAELFWDKQIVRDALGHFMPRYDVRHPKIPFIVTEDTRSIDIMMSQIVLRAAPAFLEKYAELPGFPFDVRALRASLGRVVRRSAGFAADCSLLIECMSIAIFKHQCEQPPADDFRAQRERTSKLTEVLPEQWTRMERELAGAPVAPALDWRLEDRVNLVEGAVITRSLTGSEQTEYLLIERSMIRSSLSVPHKHPWLVDFLRHLSNEAAGQFRIRDWLDEFDIDLHEFREVLNVLYQCGFIYRKGGAEVVANSR